MRRTNSSDPYGTPSPTTTTATTTDRPPTPPNGPPRITFRPASATHTFLIWPNISETTHTPSSIGLISSILIHAIHDQLPAQSACSAQNVRGDTKLTLAAAAGNIAAVTSLLEAGADPGQINGKGHCALVRASRNGHVEVIKLLIPFFNTKTQPSRQTLQLALAWAASRGHTAAVKALLDAGAEINEVTPTGHTALMLAASNGHADTVRALQALLEMDASPLLENNDGGIVLNLAERNHHEKVGKYLRRHISDDPMEAPHSSSASSTSTACTDTSSSGSTSSSSTTTSTSITSPSQTNIDHALQPGWRRLNGAAEAGDTGLASLLLKHISIDTKDASGNTCLTLAAQAGNDKFVTFWLEESADIEHTTDAGNSALILAASNGHRSTVLELLAYGANILRRNNPGMNAVQCAAKNSHADIENLLNGAAAFLKAAAQENVVEFEKTVSKVWLNCVDGSGRTALIIAVENGCVENVKLLIKKRAKLDVQDRHGNTALLIAANHPVRREELLRVLLSDASHQPNLLLKNKANTGIRDLLDQGNFHYPVPRTLLLGAFTKSGKALLEA
jgi:ankyrin repeat protein